MPRRNAIGAIPCVLHKRSATIERGFMGLQTNEMVGFVIVLQRGFIL
jgi:hypothetical protein